MGIEIPVPDPGSRQGPGSRSRATVSQTWVYEVAVDDTNDGSAAALTLRCSQPAVRDESGLYRTFWLVEGGNIVVGFANNFRLIGCSDGSAAPDQ